MPNGFSKEERVAFENILEGFQDALVLSRNVAVFNTDQTTMERTNNVMWRPQPYIATSYAGTDMTTNFDDYTQLSVPATIGRLNASLSRGAPAALNMQYAGSGGNGDAGGSEASSCPRQGSPTGSSQGWASEWLTLAPIRPLARRRRGSRQ